MKKKDDSARLETYGGHYQRFESTFRPRTAGPLGKVKEKKGTKANRKKRKKAG
jgi:hypothetical protein